MTPIASSSASDCQLYPDGRFVMRGYSQKKPFSNFLPGIAGLYGTPMWVFYVNRGQGVVSFGTKNKDNAILEFFPANKAYQMVASHGFRTFLKVLRKGKLSFYEPFKASDGAVMEISSYEFSVEETNKAQGIRTRVRYFTVPGEPLAVLARELTLTNISHDALSLEVLDGLPSVNPYGMNEFFVKNMSRTIEAWITVENVFEKKAPFFRLKVDATDRPEVKVIDEGNFYFAFLAEKGKKAKMLEPWVDPVRVFGPELDFGEPKIFYEKTFIKDFGNQICEGRTPSALGYVSLSLAPGQSKRICSFFGQAKRLELLNRYARRAASADYFEEKRKENKILVESLKSPAFTASGSSAYDLYCGQTYLDNLLRGGKPIFFGNHGSSNLLYVYSRKHGDLERDYNRFLVEPNYFSQGDGNYRDVNQNRRNDVWFDPRVAHENILIFFNLIQPDGFNPLVVKGSSFSLENPKGSRKFLLKFFGKRQTALCEKFLADPFTVGELCRFLEDKKLISRVRFEKFWAGVVPFLRRENKAEHQEGFWTDHWTYNLDLLESTLAIFPERGREIIFEKKEFTFYDSEYRVRPRDEKYFLTAEGRVRQYQAVLKDPEKSRLIQSRKKDQALVRVQAGRGEVYKTCLFVKLLCLFANKTASLDPEGIGIEMEAGKPSWYDALNGLPGLLGSSLPETFELQRLILFMIQAVEGLSPEADFKVSVPLELYEFLEKLRRLLERHLLDKGSKKNFIFWNETHEAKEKYWERTRLGFSGREKRMDWASLRLLLEHAREKIQCGIDRAWDASKPLYPTYFENEVLRWRVTEKNRLRPLEFRQKALPCFLEGPVHALKVEKDPVRRRNLVKAVRESALYDKKLLMYKVNGPLQGVSLEVGRARVFSPGWMENESVWLHMEYKWMLEVLKGGMPEEFFKDFKNVLVPFQSPERYGRSPLENSSFIASSAFVDASLHGAGFVARLSGSTAEFLNIWLAMNVGKKPFILGPDGKLSLRFEPQLPAFLFSKGESVRTFFDSKGAESKLKIPKDSVAFMFLGKSLVCYHNPRKLDTFGRLRAQVKRIVLHLAGGRIVEFKGDTVPSPYAARVRDEWVPRIDIELG